MSGSPARSPPSTTTAVAHQRATAPTIAAALRVVRDLSAELWARRADHADGFTVSLGWGTMTWEVRVEVDARSRAVRRRRGDRRSPPVLDDVPVTTDLGPGTSRRHRRRARRAVARSLIVQLAALTGPADWRLVVVADDPGRLGMVRGGFPTRSSGAGCDLGPMIAAADDGSHLAAILSRLDPSDGRHVVVVTDRPDVLSTRTGALRRYLASAPSVAVVAVVRIRRRRAAAVPQRAAHRQSVRRSMVSRPRVAARFATESTPPACPSPWPLMPPAGSPGSTTPRIPTRRSEPARRRCALSRVLGPHRPRRHRRLDRHRRQMACRLRSDGDPASDGHPRRGDRHDR